MTAQPTALTGIQPSGLPHLGNLYGALLPVRRLAETHRLRVFIADAHALNASGGDTIHDATDQLVRLLIALEIADHGVIYRQSDVPETFELAMLLANVTGKGLLNRSHAYRTAVERNLELGRPEDDGVNMGLFLYPLLMAADILIGSADVVPVGEDQRSHVEMARAIAGSFNARYGPTFRVPEGVIAEQVAVVPGTDGRKMSKSYGNVLPLLASDAELTAIVRRIPTTSLPPEEPKDPDADTLFRLYALVADPADVAGVRELYLHGGLAYGDMKSRLSGALAGSVGELRDRALAVPDAEVSSVLEAGATEMRGTAGPLLARVEQAMGVGSQYS